MSLKTAGNSVDTVAALIDRIFDQRKAAEFTDDEHARNSGLVFRRELRHVASHTGAGHDHRDGAHGAGIGAETVADAFVPVYDDGFAGDHRQDIAFRADAGAGGATYAVIVLFQWRRILPC